MEKALHELRQLGGEKDVLVFFCDTGDDTICSLLKDDFNFECCLRKLSLIDQQSVLAVRHQKIKALVSKLFTKLVLNAVRSRYSARDIDTWENIEFTSNEFGKPAMAEPIQFNSSSSNKIICIAVSMKNEPIGVDLSHEFQNGISADGFLDEFRGIFHEKEVQQLQAIPDANTRYIAFNHLWTLKESYGKYIGCGINYDLASVCFMFPKLLSARAGSQLVWAESHIENQTLHCYSAVVRPSVLPVIMSVVTAEEARIGTINVDMGHVIKDLIK